MDDFAKPAIDLAGDNAVTDVSLLNNISTYRTSVKRIASEALTVSGNEITDVVRAAATEGDGLSADSSFGIWQESTNSVPNGGCETNTTGFSTYGAGVTLSRDTVNHKFGSASLKVIVGETTETGATLTTPISVSEGEIWTGSAWIKAPAGADIEIMLGDGISNTTTHQVQTGDWQRIKLKKTINAAATELNMALITYGSQAITFYVDGWQLEESSVATPYIETDGGADARAAARVRASTALLDETQGWVAFRIRYGYTSIALPATNPYLLDWRDDANNLLGLYFETSTRKWTIARKATTGNTAISSAQTFSANDKATVVAAWTAAAIKVSVNGGAFVSTADTSIPTLAATTADLGSQAATSHLDGDILWATLGTGTLTDDDALTIYGLSDADSPLAFPGTLVNFWTADDANWQTRTDTVISG